MKNFTEDFDDDLGCECELDWNCPLHADRTFTAIERINDYRASLDEEVF